MYNTAVLRLSAGPINKINDAAIGQAAAQAFGPTTSKFAGQLGSGFWLDDTNLLYDSTMGTVYGGHFRYVRLAAAASAVVVGQAVFWDTLTNAADNLFQVTTLETGSADGAMLFAGVVLNSSWSAGNYGVVQDLGPTYCKFRGTLTSAGAAGSRVFLAAVGAGVDNGFFDVIDSANPTLFSDVSKMLGRYAGVAQEAPSSGGLKRVYINAHNVRG